MKIGFFYKKRKKTGINSSCIKKKCVFIKINVILLRNLNLKGV